MPEVRREAGRQFQEAALEDGILWHSPALRGCEGVFQQPAESQIHEPYPSALGIIEIEMNFRELVTLAWAALRAHRLRSFLTQLGLVMGVATLITVMTLIQGANAYVKNKIANLGIDVFEVSKTPVVITDFEEFIKAQHNKDITVEDLEAMRERCRHCGAVGAQVVTTARVRYRDQELTDVSIFGQTANMAYVGTRTVEQGRYFSSFEEQQAAPVCVIGYGLVEKLFGATDPVNKIVRIGPQELRVVGTIEKIGSILGQEQDDFLILPLPVFFKLRGPRYSLRLHVRAPGEAAFPAAQDEVRVLLRARRHVAPGARDDFYIGTPDSYLDLWRSISSAFFLVFVMISAIAAVVGGIVIMNIMLVSVTERTKEIGVRRACGARRQDILRQFLAEALLSCFIGGVVGVLIGFGAAEVLKRFTSFPADVRLWVAAMGVVFASAIGLFFGIYPATRAARLDPVVALRSE